MSRRVDWGAETSRVINTAPVPGSPSHDSRSAWMDGVDSQSRRLRRMVCARHSQGTATIASLVFFGVGGVEERLRPDVLRARSAFDGGGRSAYWLSNARSGWTPARWSYTVMTWWPRRLHRTPRPVTR